MLLLTFAASVGVSVTAAATGGDVAALNLALGLVVMFSPAAAALLDARLAGTGLGIGWRRFSRKLIPAALLIVPIASSSDRRLAQVWRGVCLVLEPPHRILAPDTDG